MLDDELRDLVSADPSPDWLPRLSAQVAADAARHSNFGHSSITLVAATLLIAVLVMSFAPRWFRGAPATSDDGMIPARALTHGPSALPLAAEMRGAVRPRPIERRAGNHVGDAIPAPIEPMAVVQIDSREARSLQQLFAAPPVGHALDVPEHEPGPIVMPEIAIDPILSSPVEGDRQ